MVKKKVWLLVTAGILALALAAPTAYGAITGSQNTQNPQEQSFFSQMLGWHQQWLDQAQKNGLMTADQANAWQDHLNYMRSSMGYMMGGNGSYGGMGGMMGGYYNSPTVSNPAPDVNQQGDVADLTLKVLPGGKTGSDGKMHDAFSPADFTLKKGVPVRISIYNYDDMPHSLTSYALGLNIQAKGAAKEGTPGVTTITFIPQKEGDYKWVCVDPCDLEANGWAMSQDGYMQGTIHVQA